MNKTFIKVFSFNYDVSSMSGSYNSLESRLEDFMKDKPNLEIKQMEFLYGNIYGAKMAVLFQEAPPLNQTNGKEE